MADTEGAAVRALRDAPAAREGFGPFRFWVSLLMVSLPPQHRSLPAKLHVRPVDGAKTPCF